MSEENCIILWRSRHHRVAIANLFIDFLFDVSMMAGPLHFGVNQTLICYKVIICNIVEIIVINVNRREIKRTIVLSLWTIQWINSFSMCVPVCIHWRCLIKDPALLFILIEIICKNWFFFVLFFESVNNL